MQSQSQRRCARFYLLLRFIAEPQTPWPIFLSVGLLGSSQGHQDIEEGWVTPTPPPKKASNYMIRGICFTRWLSFFCWSGYPKP